MAMQQTVFLSNPKRRIYKKENKSHISRHMRLKCLHFLGKLRVNGQTSRTIFFTRSEWNVTFAQLSLKALFKIAEISFSILFSWSAIFIFYWSFQREMFLHGPSFNGNHRMFKIFFKVKVQVEFNYMYMQFPLTLKKFFHLSDDVI